MRKNHVPCRLCGQRGAPGLIAALNVEEGSILGPEPVRMETLVLDVPRYCSVLILEIKLGCCFNCKKKLRLTQMIPLKHLI